MKVVGEMVSPQQETVYSNALGHPEVVEQLFARITWRLLPLLVACYVLAFIDRINISFAQLGMKQTLPFNDVVYATGAGVFFIGYLLFEIPSNLVLEKIGIRKTLLRIMGCWGVTSGAMAFVETEMQLYVMRFLLGVFEAGFFPGVILYLTYWYPAERRGKIFAMLTTAIVVAPIIAGPLSGAILKYCNGGAGLHGWQWLFILQGLPACLLSLVAFYALADKPAYAAWLTKEEKDYLERCLAHQSPVSSEGRGVLIKQLLTDPIFYMLVLANVLFSGAGYTLVFWIPSLINGWGVQDPFQVGIYTVIPSVFALAGMILISQSSDRSGDRRWHFAMATGLAAAGVLVTVLANDQLAPSLAGLCLIGFGQAALLPIYTTITSSYVSRNIAAAGIALLASVGHIGSAITPTIVAEINTAWGGQSLGLCVVALMFLCAGSLILLALRPSTPGT